MLAAVAWVILLQAGAALTSATPVSHVSERPTNESTTSAPDTTTPVAPLSTRHWSTTPTTTSLDLDPPRCSSDCPIGRVRDAQWCVEDHCSRNVHVGELPSCVARNCRNATLDLQGSACEKAISCLVSSMTLRCQEKDNADVYNIDRALSSCTERCTPFEQCGQSQSSYIPLFVHTRERSGHVAAQIVLAHIVHGLLIRNQSLLESVRLAVKDTIAAQAGLPKGNVDVGDISPVGNSAVLVEADVLIPSDVEVSEVISHLKGSLRPSSGRSSLARAVRSIDGIDSVRKGDQTIWLVDVQLTFLLPGGDSPDGFAVTVSTAVETETAGSSRSGTAIATSAWIATLLGFAYSH